MKDGVRLCPSSRIWTNVVIEANTVVEEVVLLPYDKPFYFHTDVGRYTGMAATSIASLVEMLTKVEAQSLEFHLYRRDFERWIREVIEAPALAESEGEELRQELIKIVKEWREYTKEAATL
ncbi:MAG: hypothetical protein ACUVWK_05530 [Nitrososphaerales archaeon]